MITKLTMLLAALTIGTSLMATNLMGTSYGSEVSFTSVSLYYMAKTDGNWSSTSIWYTNTSGGSDQSTYTSAAAETPTASNSAGIIINADVTVAADVSIDQTTVNSGKALTINSGQTLTVANGTGTDLTVSGTGDVDVNGTIDATGARFTFSGTGTMEVSGTAISFGTFTPGTGTVTYDGGTQTIPSHRYYNLTTSGSGAQTLGGNVIVENTLNTGTGTTFALSSYTAIIGSSNTGTGSWTNAATFSANTGTVKYGENGDQTVLNTSSDGITYKSITLSGSGTKTFSGTTTATGGVTVDGNLTVDGAGASSTYIQAHATSAASATNRVLTFNGGNTATISDITIRNGKSNIGGGIYNTGILAISNSSISDNIGTNSGGGLMNEGTLAISNSTISGNISSMGGGIMNWLSATITSISNSTISGNTSNEGGGGIFNLGGITSLSNSTIANNHSDNDDSGSEQGGGIFNLAPITAKNTIVANNYRGSGTTTSDDFFHSSGTLTDGGYNVVKYSNKAANATGGFDAVTNILYNTKYGESGISHSSWTQGGTAVSGSLGLSVTLALNSSTNGTYTLALDEDSFAAASATTGIPSASNWNSSPLINGIYPDQRGIERTANQNTSIGAYSANYICTPSTSTINPTECNSLVSPSGNYTWTTTGAYMDTIPNAGGCDSVITVNLTINYSSTGIDTQTVCDSLIWIDGITYYVDNNTATDTLINVVGCDSVVTLNLTVNYSNTGIDTQTVCDSLIWIDGITYYSDNNTATDTLINVVGCDSVVTLNLTVNYCNTGTDLQIACNSYIWIDGNTYTSSNNTATHTLTNVAGCDSVVTLNLTVVYTPTADAGADTSIVEPETHDYTLSGTATNQQLVLWTTSGDGTFDDATSLTATYTVGSNDIDATEATLTLTSYAISPCSPDVEDEMVLAIIRTPVTQATEIIISSVQATEITIDWTDGSGAKRVVFVTEVGPYRSPTAQPVDSTTYIPNTVYGSGTQIGTSGWYCIYNGTGSSAILTGLTPNTNYKFMVCDYNGNPGGEYYNINTASNNPNQIASVPIADWAVYLSLFLIGGFVVVRYRRKLMTI